jgi:hypothetical protein
MGTATGKRALGHLPPSPWVLEQFSDYCLQPLRGELCLLEKDGCAGTGEHSGIVGLVIRGSGGQWDQHVG